MTTLDLVSELHTSPAHISRNLRKLRESGLTCAVRDGRLVLYSLNIEALARLGFDLLDAIRR
jgi:DNA-binding transcriptional ArsR family regulator